MSKRDDSGIFNPPDPAANVGESLDSDKSRVTDGSSEPMCAECVHFRRCAWLVNRKHDDRGCDWSPSRFVPLRVGGSIPATPFGESSNSGDGWVAGGSDGLRCLGGEDASPEFRELVDLVGLARCGALVRVPCGRCHRSTVTPPYDSCPDCVARLAKSLAEEMRKVRALEGTLKSAREARAPQLVGAVRGEVAS